MRQKITTKQLLSARNLFKNLKDFQEKRLGTIEDMDVMTHQMMPNTILVKYAKEFTMGGNQAYEFKIAAINQDGQIHFIESKFKDAFEQAAFLSICQQFDIEDESSYDKID